MRGWGVETIADCNVKQIESDNCPKQITGRKEAKQITQNNNNMGMVNNNNNNNNNKDRDTRKERRKEGRKEGKMKKERKENADILQSQSPFCL